MKKINIKGQDYVPVHERLTEFWKNNPSWSIRTKILESEGGKVRFRACIYDEHGILRATGHAEEKEDSSFINKTSALENAETSATGRALGILGIAGIVPMFTSDPNYVNIGEIVLGGLGLLVGIYARQNTKYNQQTKDFSRQTRDYSDRQRQENEQLRKENDQGRRDNNARQQQENEQLRKQLDQQKQDNEQLRKHNN